MSEFPKFESEAALVAAFVADVAKGNAIAADRGGVVYSIYHETAGWDLLLVGPSGLQIGIEAKLTLNAKVLEQALPKYDGFEGPDYRAVLVPRVGVQHHLARLARHVGVTILLPSESAGDQYSRTWSPMSPDLPDEASDWRMRGWHDWLPARRCELPDYVPDVQGGKAAPVMLTPWKVKAIKLMILLDRRGVVTRADMKALELSPSRWTDAYCGFLARGNGGYVRCSSTPDLRAQHPQNYAEIEADFEAWSARHDKAQGVLL